MRYKASFSISQCTSDDSRLLHDELWAQAFCRVFDRYWGLPILYSALLRGESGSIDAAAAVVYERGTAWVCGLSCRADLGDVYAEFAQIELLSHLTDFSNFLQLDNIIALVSERDMPVWHQCGYTASAILGNYSVPLSAPNVRADRAVREILPADMNRVQTFAFDIIHERRDALWNADWSGYLYEEAGAVRGILLRAGDMPIYAVCEPAARALIGLKLQLGNRVTGVPDDNTLAKAIATDYGCVLQGEVLRVSLGRDNRWKPLSVFSGFTDFCV